MSVTTEVVADAVRAVFDELSRTWAAGDGDGFAAHFADDATVVLPGAHLPSRDAIRAGMTAAFAGPLKGTSRSHQVLSARALGTDAAVVVTDSRTEFAGSPGPAEWATWVFTRRDDRWLVAAYHGCPQASA
ncbi:SgcJ/EcaC family oxidoreductase [Pseudonocardia spinosispora]|uniref:SgcJ/EcaC family oxidoreductase n=1 Tax=Pseudonocardia spinosispora TaxID=103441 RepID=UPI00041A7097|nr:SgcJ/EcaC family oxidoreductase [Pseudonocardia spinosispora]